MKLSTSFVSAGSDYATYERHIPAPCFRKELELSELKTAGLSICGLGYYELFINGKKITKGLLSPYISNPDHILYYDVYDLMPYLHVGKNVIGVMLGNGLQNCPGGQVWGFQKARYRSAPKFALSFEAEQLDGVEVAFEAHDGFVWKYSPILLDDSRIGEIYDARLELGAWTEIGYDASDWQATTAAETPRGECRICDIDPIVVTKELSPISVTYGKITHFPTVPSWIPAFEIPTDEENNGGYIYDFGVNAAGLCRLKIKHARKGQKIVLQFAETLAEDGGLDLRYMIFLPIRYAQRDIYICKGGDEEYIPTFTYHGFRYCLVMGIDEDQATSELLTYAVMNTDLQPRASFECSDETVNKIWNATIVSDLANFYHFPTDCPHREKNGWTGDASLSAEQMLMALTPERNFREWLRNIEKAMNEEGNLPGYVPNPVWRGNGHGVAWDSVIVNLPYYTWLYTGDRQILSENAAMIFRYLHFLTASRNSEGLVNFWIGDWCPTGLQQQDGYKTPNEFTGTVLSVDFCRKAAKIFELLGMTAEKQYAATVGEEFYIAARKAFINVDATTTACDTQTAQAMAIFYDIFTETEKKSAVAHLVKLLENNDNAFDCGVLGLRVLFHVLSEYGYSEIAYHMIARKEFPSYGYIVENGGTSLWENFLKVEENHNSLNHHFFGDVISWMMKNLAGIHVNPLENDPNTILFLPRLIESLQFVKATYKAPAGEIAVEWHREGEEVVFRFNIPSGVKAEFCADDDWRLKETFMTRIKLNENREIRLIRRQ